MGLFEWYLNSALCNVVIFIELHLFSIAKLQKQIYFYDKKNILKKQDKSTDILKNNDWSKTRQC